MLRSGSAPELVRRALAGLVASASLTSASCDVLTGGCGDDLLEEPAAIYTEGTTVDGHYQSSGWDPDDLLDFPPGMGIRFVHDLGAVPSSWAAYIATAREGDGTEIVLSTGVVELTDIDDEGITVRNGTCADLLVLVVAESR